MGICILYGWGRTAEGFTALLNDKVEVNSDEVSDFNISRNGELERHRVVEDIARNFGAIGVRVVRGKLAGRAVVVPGNGVVSAGGCQDIGDSAGTRLENIAKDSSQDRGRFLNNATDKR